MRSLLLLSCVLLAAGTRADSANKRTKDCDDGIAKPAGVVCAHVPAPVDATCRDAKQIMALLHGCYFCVDQKTCLVGSVLSPGTGRPTESDAPIPTATARHKAAESGVAMAKANNNVQSPATGTELAIASEDHADSGDSWTSRLSNWAFAAPVAALALVGVAIAVRTRSGPKRGREFERLQEEETGEINPFCASVLAQDSDDGELELVDEEQKENEEGDAEDMDEEDCDDEGPDIIVAHSILDDIDEEEEDDACL